MEANSCLNSSRQSTILQVQYTERGSPGHAQTRGAIKRTNYDLDYIDKYQKLRSKHIPAINVAHNSSWHSAIDMRPLKVLMGTDIRNPLTIDLLPIENQELAREIVQQTKEVQDLARLKATESQK